MRLSIDPAHPDYPNRLLELAPYQLRVDGKLPKQPGVAIVGTRRPTNDAAQFTRSLARRLAERGVVVWSGGALGIDSAAHRGALDAGKPTVVVLGSGLDRLFPDENVDLFREVVRGGGALLSMFGDADPAMPTRFLQRNRVLAGATEMTIVIECDYRSGARSAARHAKSLRRPVGVVLQGPWLKWGHGCYAEHYENGAIVITGESDILRVIGMAQQLPLLALDEPASQLPLDKLTDLERSVVRAVADGSDNLDTLCEALSLPAASVCVLVMDLTLRGHLLETPRGLRSAADTGKTPGT